MFYGFSEFARDTSDTSSHTWLSSSNNSNDSVHVEFELESQSENSISFDDASSSEPDVYFLYLLHNIQCIDEIRHCLIDGFIRSISCRWKS